jgi:flagellar biosynthetic protein FliP
MSKIKKTYCVASFIFACAVLIFTTVFLIARPEQALASSTGSDTTKSSAATTDDEDESGSDESSADPDSIDIDSMDPDSITEITPRSTEVADHDDETDGLQILYNNDSGSVSTPIRMLLVLTILSLAPSLLIMLTSYTRIIIVLHFIRTAIGTQTAPPNQVLIGLALFLTFFIMWPTFQEINTNALKPLDAGEITTDEFIEAAEQPIREFMIDDAKVQLRDVNLFMEIADLTYEDEEELSDVPFRVLVPAFMVSELRKAFIMGFLIYIPFIVIDMVVASVLMSMGMMMLPPTTISLPFKILLFVLADGWNLVIGSLVNTFY